MKRDQKYINYENALEAGRFKERNNSIVGAYNNVDQKRFGNQDICSRERGKDKGLLGGNQSTYNLLL